ncbi:MAG TPA: SLOG family protein [Pseudoflavonifractor sp.]|nr:SLOG family protein [Pseudoflavonifractor sp.]
MQRDVTCCFTGHRPDKLPWGADEGDPRCADLKNRIAAALEEAYEKGMRHFICGMALGADLYFCEAALDLRRRCPGVTVEAAIPCEEQAARWGERDRNRYFALVKDCDYETMVQHHYDRGCMLRRNRYMVDRSSMLIAAYDGLLGGTMYTLAYAMKKGLEIVTLELT